MEIGRIGASMAEISNGVAFLCVNKEEAYGYEEKEGKNGTAQES